MHVNVMIQIQYRDEKSITAAKSFTATRLLLSSYKYDTQKIALARLSNYDEL